MVERVERFVASGYGWPDELVVELVRSGCQVLRFDHRDTGLSGGTIGQWLAVHRADRVLSRPR